MVMKEVVIADIRTMILDEDNITADIVEDHQTTMEGWIAVAIMDRTVANMTRLHQGSHRKEFPWHQHPDPWKIK